MKTARPYICLVAMLSVSLAFASASIAQEKSAQRTKRTSNGAMAPIEDVPGLPRVLLIGDSISIGYTLPVRKLLAEKANLHRPQANCGDTARGLDSIEEWLGEGNWDVIHFNWGLHDLKWIDDEQQVPIKQYEKNLKQLVKRLKKTGATLVWRNTTPVPEGCTPPRTDEDVVAYNAVAEKIMTANGIAIHDLYSFALPQLDKIQLPANVHFGPEGSEMLAVDVARVILEELESK